MKLLTRGVLAFAIAVALTGCFKENRSPIVEFTVSSSSPRVGESVRFSAESSYDPDGRIVGFDWDFGDGHGSNLETCYHAYSAEGSYFVFLTVTDNDGYGAGCGTTVTVVPASNEPGSSPTFVTDKTSLSVPEGSTATFRVKLSSQPTSTVYASVSRSSGDDDIEVTGGLSLTFTTSNWSTYQTVTLRAYSDSDCLDGSATIKIHRTWW